MAEHAHRTIERLADVAVVGGSAAGLAAALQLGRQRRSVIVVDSGEPRNAPAAHMHGYLGHEGVAPAELTSIGREEIRSYGAEVLQGRVVGAELAGDGHIRLALTGGHAILARRLLIATGLADDLPDVEGIADHWGRDVVHCPFCHGHELRDRRIVQVVTHPMGLHPTALYHHLTDRLAVVVDEHVAAGADLDVLRAAGVEVHVARAVRIAPAPHGGVAAVELSDGRRLEADAVAIAPRFRARIEPFAALGVAAVPHPSGLGDHVVTDDAGATSVPGVYAAGNVTDPGHQVLHAAAAGSRVGAMIAMSLAGDDLASGGRRSGNQHDWDHRYSGDAMWSGNPNGTLVAEVAGLTPGRVLDVGAGEGGDAIWLAEHGWTVTANDISQRALDRVAAAADARGVSVECVRGDADVLGAFAPAQYDLVSAQYASIPRSPDGRSIHNLLGAVAPGGTVLVVGHDLEPMRTPVDTREHSRMFDPDAFVRVGDIARVVADDPSWHIERFEKRPRPAGAVSTHHVDDEILRARRR